MDDPPENPLAGRIALVTGSAERVGKVVALALAQAGADIIVNHLDRKDAAEATVAEIEALGRRAIAVEADVSNPSHVERMMAAAESFGGLHILVNSASNFVTAPFDELSHDDWRASLSVILTGAFLCTQRSARLMRDGGKIINVIGISATENWPDYVSHSVAKAGLVKLTEVTAVALGPGIQVNGISPGTLLINEGDAHGSVELPDLGGLMPRGTAEDLAALVVALCSSGDYLTGAIIPLDGGRRLV